MDCINCGAENLSALEGDDCVRCGRPLTDPPEPDINDSGTGKINWVLAVLSFVVPALGLILYGVYKYDAPKPARVYLLGAAVLIGLWIVVVSALFLILPIITALSGAA